MIGVFANGPGGRGSILGQVMPKTQKKTVLDTSRVNIKVGIKGKWINLGNGIAPSLQLGIVAIEKGTLGSLDYGRPTYL